ncbi:MAG: class I SAM-dependent methyltransferase [Anaerolineae bacterium]|nr:class I SAM-dependent methyltransferase [Anaerolineae bacterium]
MKRLFRSRHLLSSREAYHRWAKNYPPHAHNPFMELESQVMTDLMPDLQGKRVLDLACGTGRWGLYAWDHGAECVFSLDDSFAMLRSGRPSRACLADMIHLPLALHTIDVVLCGLAIGHTPHIQAVFQELQRVLVPGGVALFSDVHPFQGWMGGKRTFQSEGKTYMVEHHIHGYSQIHSAAALSHLTIDAVREAGISPTHPPAVLVIRLTSAG